MTQFDKTEANVGPQRYGFRWNSEIENLIRIFISMGAETVEILRFAIKDGK